jgi:hypothetical protein
LHLDSEMDGVAMAEEVNDGKPNEGDSAGVEDNAHRGTLQHVLGTSMASRGASPNCDQQ